MNVQPDLIDAMAARDAGIARIELSNKEFLAEARTVALEIGHRQATVTIDDVRDACAERGLVPISYQAWGPLFMDGNWEWIGKWVRSKQVQGHGNPIRVWRLKGEIRTVPLSSNHCAKYCKRADFQNFMMAIDEHHCIVLLRERLGITSRAELDSDARKRRLWQGTVKEFEAWLELGSGDYCSS